MKKIVLWGSLFMLLMLGVAVTIAFRFGQKSPILASGTVSLSDSLKDSAAGIRTLFITVFDANSSMPMPYGAMRENLSDDPAGEFFYFSITPERLQVMNPNRPMPRLFRIKARLDRDGQGGMDQPGDLTGTVDTVQNGAKDVALIIDKKVGASTN